MTGFKNTSYIRKSDSRRLQTKLTQSTPAKWLKMTTTDMATTSARKFYNNDNGSTAQNNNFITLGNCECLNVWCRTTYCYCYYYYSTEFQFNWALQLYVTAKLFLTFTTAIRMISSVSRVLRSLLIKIHQGLQPKWIHAVEMKFLWKVKVYLII